jgi:hypothetical protein
MISKKLNTIDQLLTVKKTYNLMIKDINLLENKIIIEVFIYLK